MLCLSLCSILLYQRWARGAKSLISLIVMDFWWHAGALVRLALISEQPGCFMKHLKNLETAKTLLKIQSSHKIGIKYPRMSCFIKEQTSWHKHGRGFVIFLAWRSPLFSTTTTKSKYWLQSEHIPGVWKPENANIMWIQFVSFVELRCASRVIGVCWRPHLDAVTTLWDRLPCWVYRLLMSWVSSCLSDFLAALSTDRLIFLTGPLLF